MAGLLKQLSSTKDTKEKKAGGLLAKLSKQDFVGPVFEKVESKPKPLSNKLQQIVDGKTFNPLKTTEQKQLEQNNFTSQKNLNGAFNILPKKSEKIYKVPAPISFATGLADTASLGLIETQANRNTNPKGLPKLDSGAPSVKDFLDTAKSQNPKSYMGGQMAGYLVPGMGIERGATSLLKPLLKGTSGLVGKIATGAVTGGVQELIEGGIRNFGDGEITGQDFKDIGKRTAQGTVLGAFGDAALYGAGKGINKLIGNKFTPKVSDIPVEPLNDVLSQPNKSNVITPPIVKELPQVKYTTLRKPNKLIDNLPVLDFSKETDFHKIAREVAVIKEKYPAEQANKILSRVEVANKFLSLENDVDLAVAKKYIDMLKDSEAPSISVYRSSLTSDSLKNQPKIIDNDGISRSFNKFTKNDIGKEMYTIGDGNHRAVASKLSGKKSTPVNFAEYGYEAPIIKKGSSQIGAAQVKTITPRLKTAAANIDNSSNLNIPVEKGFADGIITETKPKVKNERGFSYNTRTDTAMNEDVRKVFDENPLTYEPLSNKETLAKAESRMSGDFTKDYRSWTETLNNFDPSDIPLARKLANEAAKNGDMVTARQIIADVSEKLTQSGQYSQAASILRKADPATFNGFMDNQLKKLNEQGRKMYGKKWTDFSLTDDEMKQLYSKDVIDEDTREKLMESIYDRISQTMPSSKMEKFDAWRRTAMLLNPKTHIRNVVGNGIMGIMRKSADTLGAGLEKVFLKEGARTKSFGWSLDSGLKSTVDDVWKLESKNLTSYNRYDINNLKFMNRDKRIFKSNVLNGLDNFTKGTLSLEDKVFLERAYKDALGGYMKSNGMKEATQAAKDYAQRRSFEATFKQANFLSNAINKAKRIKGVGKFVEGAIPFTQTPANIMMRGVEYSPLGIVKGLFGATSGNTGAQIIEDFAKGLTGSAALGVGYVLASMGAAKYQRSKSDTVAGLESEVGEQSSSIVTPWGSYTFDWAQPAAIPLAMGISFYEGLQKKNSSKAEALLNAIYAGGDTIVNMTMLRNIKDIMGGGGSVTQKIMGIPVSYIEQAIPSLMGQIAKTVDTTKRSTYDPNPFKAELNKVQAKIPVLSKNLNPDRDIFGQTQDTGGWLQQFISPGYVKGKSTEPVANELVRLYKANKETDFLPKYLDGSFTQDGIEYRLSGKELEQLKKDIGQTTLSKMKSAVFNPSYKISSDKEKMKQLRLVANSVYNDYKEEYVKSKK